MRKKSWKWVLVLGLALALAPGAEAQTTQCVTNAIAGGTGDALTVPLLPCGTATNVLILTLTATNTTTSPTLQMVGYAALPIVDSTGGALSAGQLVAGAVVMLTGTEQIPVDLVSGNSIAMGRISTRSALEYGSSSLNGTSIVQVEIENLIIGEQD